MLLVESFQFANWTTRRPLWPWDKFFLSQDMITPILRTNLHPPPGGPHVMSARSRQEGVTPSYPIKPMINALLSWKQLSQPQWHTRHRTHTHTHVHARVHTSPPKRHTYRTAHTNIREQGWPLLCAAQSVFAVQYVQMSCMSEDEELVFGFVLVVTGSSWNIVFIFLPAQNAF